MVALLFCADSNAAVFKVSLDPDPALLGSVYYNCSYTAHPLASTCDVATISEIRSVYLYPIQIYAQLAVPKLKKNRPLDLTTPVLGVFCHG